MQFLYNEVSGSGSLISSCKIPPSELAKAVVAEFPSVSRDLPVIIYGNETVNDKFYIFKAIKDRLPLSSEGCYIHAFAVSDASEEALYDLFDARFYEPEEASLVIRSRMLSEKLNSVKGNWGFRITKAALRAVLKRLYSGMPACLVVNDKIASESGNAEGAVKQIFRYLDTGMKKKLFFAFNTTSIAGTKPGVCVVPESIKAIPQDNITWQLAQSADKGTLLDSFVDYLLDSEPAERSLLHRLIDKYAGYYTGTELERELAVYKAFVVGDAELVYNILLEYNRNEYANGRNIDINPGILTLLRQETRDRQLLKLVYNGYDNLSFSQMIENNRADIRFVSLIKSGNELLSGDSAESYNILIASRLTDGTEDDEKRRELLQSEAEAINSLLVTALSPLEISVIEAYKKYISMMLSQVEEEAVESDGKDTNESETSGFTQIYDNEAVTAVPAAEKGVAENSDNKNYEELTALRDKIRKISLMNALNYQDVYYTVFSSELIDSLLDFDKEDDDDTNERALKELYNARLSTLFPTYGIFKNELHCELSKKGSVFSELLSSERYSDTVCYALEACNSSELADVIASYNKGNVNEYIFIPLLYKKAGELVQTSGIDFLQRLIESCENNTVKAVLLSVLLQSEKGGRLSELTELASSYRLINAYLPGDISVNISSGKEMICGASLLNYIKAVSLANSGEILPQAVVSDSLNELLLLSGIPGYSKRISGSTEVDEKQEDKDNSLPRIQFVNAEPEDRTGDANKPPDTGKAVNTVESGIENGTDNEDIVFISENRKNKERDMSKYIDVPETLRVKIDSGNADEMKVGIFVLAGLTLLTLIILIILIW